MATLAAAVSKAADAVVALFSLVIALAAPLLDSQAVLPRRLYPALLVNVYRWFLTEFDHYLLADPPPFLRGFVWLALTFLWPVCIANLYGSFTRRRRWVANTSLMAGVFMLTYLSAMFGEMLGSGRATRKLIQFYAPFVVIGVVLVLRGLCSGPQMPAAATVSSSVESDVQKKSV